MKWFFSDPHFDHDKVRIGLRAEHFFTIQEWNQGFIQAVNKTVIKGDQLFILGDFAFTNLARWRNQFKCKNIVLIRGNHDPSVSACQRVFGTQNVKDTLETKICGYPCFLSHYPHAFWPKSHRGSYHLYGHMHGQRETTLDQWMPERKSVDVSPENIYRITGRWGAISEEELLMHFGNAKGHDHVEFYQKLTGSY